MSYVVYGEKDPQEIQIEGLIFDMDGVLFDTERDSIASIIRIGKEMGFEIPREFIIKNMGRNQAEESVIYREFLGDSFDPEEFWRRYWTDRNARYDRQGMPIKPGAMELLKAALEKKIPCVVASSSLREEVWKSVDRVALREYFVDVIGGDMFEHSKPQPDIFLVGANVIGIKPENCMVIEDSLNGMKAARAAEMIVAYVKDVPTYPESELKKYCDFSFESAADIIPLLSK